ncbi:MAG: NAD(P)-binding protein [Gammaproteobacteria bacterium]|nr:NAD(P)-binding protein [Gammaproteobacteria bacterium]
MACDLKISRRDFINGIAFGAVAGAALNPAEVLAAAARGGAYPPSLTGLRGAHAGSFEVAHAVSLAGAQFARPKRQTDSLYDLVVVGGGLSGLAAAFRYRQRAGESARILVLDNHDDFGGHAKRNEFEVDGHQLIGYGGSQSIDKPSSFSPAARQLLVDAGIEVERFYNYFDHDYFKSRQLGSGVYFSRTEYGKDVTAPSVIDTFSGPATKRIEQAVSVYPFDDQAKASLLGLLQNDRDYLAGGSREERISRLRRMSYRDYLLNVVGVSDDVYYLFRDNIRGLWGVGWDALSALEAYRQGMPGTQGLGIGELPVSSHGIDEPYIFHFPDGNAGVARALVRRLIPEAVPGDTMEDLLGARVRYDVLDASRSRTCIRLQSTAVDVRHTNDQKQVDVTYVSDEVPYRVRAKHVVLACDNAMIPHICPELPHEQAEAIGYAVKVPLVYISVAVRNWRAFADLGFYSISIPKPLLMHSFGMDFPVSMGGYRFTQNPDEPTILHGTYVPTVPDQGLSAREQHERGRRQLYSKTFAEFETSIVGQIQGALAPGGFDAARDIAGITVNRWPHGYAYEYNDLSDPEGWGPGEGPHVRGRAQIGRISIANADASAFAYINGAFDAADRAVNEQLIVS